MDVVEPQMVMIYFSAIGIQITPQIKTPVDQSDQPGFFIEINGLGSGYFFF